ncbi:hypothetical protein L1887_35229 [Cichorium endivia]|nr:hypothetical protein L1887_35229 [Cichorium endivia]
MDKTCQTFKILEVLVLGELLFVIERTTIKGCWHRRTTSSTLLLQKSPHQEPNKFNLLVLSTTTFFASDSITFGGG